MLRLFVVLAFFVSTSLIVTPPAQAQAPERRIAFVVGNESYAAGALPTAANDAGLIAQTLQAAGFEVVGARDLDAETFRESYAEFLKRLTDAGPEAVAFVYLAGYGLQYGNDNFFVPIGARLANDTDVPISTIRLADLAAPLVTLPLKARFLVYDLGYVPPFKLGGAPLAGSLGLVEAGTGTSVAFNAAPGTVAPVGKGNYGLYAQSLAAELRVGGLSPGEIFDRVRLRVSEESQGAEVPWDDTKVDPAFRFFDRDPGAPPEAAPAVADAMMRRPLRDLPPRQAYPAALARDTVRSYDEFIRAYPDDPLAKRARVLLAARREALTWQRTAAVGTPQAYWSYLRLYPRGPHAGAADMRLRQIAAALQPPPDFVPIGYDVPPPPPDEIVYLDRPVVYLDDPSYGLPAPPPPPMEWLPAVPVAFLDQPPPRRAPGLFALPAPVFVPLPAYFNPPRFVAVPQENVFFTAPGGVDRRQVLGTRGVGIDIHRPLAPGAGGRGPGAIVPLPGAAAQRATVLESRGIRTPEQLRDVRQRPGGLNRVLSGPATRDGLSPAQRLPGDGARPLPPGGNVRPLSGPGPGPGAGSRGPGGALPGERRPGVAPLGGRGPGPIAVPPGGRPVGGGVGERRPVVAPPAGPAGGRAPGARPAERGPAGSPPGGRVPGVRPGERQPEGGGANGRGPGARPGERGPGGPGERSPNVRPERGPGGARPSERSPSGTREPGTREPGARGPADGKPGGRRPNERPGGAGPGPTSRRPGETRAKEPRPSEPRQGARPAGRGPGAERGEPGGAGGRSPGTGERPGARPGAGRPEGGGRPPPGAGPGAGPGGGHGPGGGPGGGAGRGPGGGGRPGAGGGGPGGGGPGGGGPGGGGARHGGGGGPGAGGGLGGGRP